MSMHISVYVPEKQSLEKGEPLRRALADIDIGVTYAEMMRYRIDGNAAEECNDIYYICTDEKGDLISRLWMGWGRHEGAVANWGNFFTAPECRGRGIGRIMLDFWYKDTQTRDSLPLALFCTAGSEGLVKLYEPYGFRPALKGTSCGPLYCPLGNSPDTFEKFCTQYYKPTKGLVFKRATLEWRHEIDCLLKFAMLNAGLDYLPEGMTSLEASLLENGAENVEIIFTDESVPVGLAHLRKDGTKDVRIYPSYLHLI